MITGARGAAAESLPSSSVRVHTSLSQPWLGPVAARAGAGHARAQCNAHASRRTHARHSHVARTCRTVTTDIRRGGVVFNNERFAVTYVEREANESVLERQERGEL